MKLRAHFALVVAVTAVPLLALAVTIVVLVQRQERASVERGLQETARALTVAVDREFETSVRGLQTLGTSHALDTGDLATFYEDARRAREVNPRWLTVFLVDSSGRQLLSLLRPFGTALPTPAPFDDIMSVFRTGQPRISNLFVGPLSGRHVIVIVVPAVHGGRITHALGVSVMAESLSGLLAEQVSSSPSVASIRDRNGLLVARSRDHGRFIGQPPRPDFKRRLERARDGGATVFESLSLDNTPLYTAIGRVSLSDFTVIVGLPTTAIRTEAHRWLLAVGAALIVAAALVASALLARRVTRPIAALSRGARQLAAGESITEAPSASVTEVTEVHRALVDAARAVGERAAERERRIAAEAARAEAEAAGARIASVQRITDSALAELTLDDLLRALLSRVREALGADTATILLLDRAGTALAPVASVGLAEEIHERIAVPLGVGVAGSIALSRSGLIVDDVAGMQAVSPALSARVKSLVGVPLRIGEQLIGVVHVGSSSARHFTEADLELLRLVAERAAVAVERARLHDDTVQARAVAEAASRAKDQFLAMLGHELRNPLAAIASALSVLSRAENDADTTRRAREVMARQVDALVGIVDDLLDVGRVATGKISLRRRPVDLCAIAERCLESVETTGRSVQHAVTSRLTPAWVHGDETRLEQVTSNLLVNALKYTPAGGGITVTVGVEGADSVLRVVDTGIGIAHERLPLIFDLFFQGEQGPDRAEGGLGIGLTLVKRLVELHGGTVTAASDGPNAGSTFTVRLPAVAPAADPAPPPDAPRTPRRILLVEDNDDARDMLKMTLELGGHEVAVAANGHEALEVASRVPVDVALIDIGLPGLDGYAVAERLRNLPGGSRMTLVAVTGYGQPEDRRRAKQAGFDAHVVKPVDPAMLDRMLAASPLSATNPNGTPGESVPDA